LLFVKTAKYPDLNSDINLPFTDNKMNHQHTFHPRPGTHRTPDEPLENPGLDADHSSDDSIPFNNDNDRISHNPDGEDDDHDTHEESGSSPLADK
jgi:hypothetical protein